MDNALGRRTGRVSGIRWLAFAAVAAALLVGAGCGKGSPSAVAAEILERYRKVSGSKPLAASGMIRIKLSPAREGDPAGGSCEILWEPGRYRETVSSAGWTTVRGIEFGKAYFTDEDGVTRVVSDQALWELTTRSYFWRRAWLFRDHGNARLSLGPADEASVSVSLKPVGSPSLLLSFSRRDGRLLAVTSPGFRLEFASATSFRDVSDRRRPVAGDITWVGLPTGRMSNPSIGGGRAQFSEASVRVPFERQAGAVIVSARISGRALRLAVDAAADGPVGVSPTVAAVLALHFQTDVYGRSVAGGASLEVGSVRYPSLFVASSDSVPAGADAIAGACFFREAVVELDPDAGLFGLHEESRWVIPEGFVRIPIDDDGDRPVAILDRGHQALRLTAGTNTGDQALLLSAASAGRAGLADQTEATGLTWGILRLAPAPLRAVRDGFFPDWGDDGSLGFPMLLRYHSYFQMPLRWIYVRPAGKGS